MAKNYKNFKTSKFLIFDNRKELSMFILVEKVYLDSQNGQFWQILYHVENGQLKSEFGRKRWKFQNYIKHVIIIHILQF